MASKPYRRISYGSCRRHSGGGEHIQQWVNVLICRWPWKVFEDCGTFWRDSLSIQGHAYVIRIAAVAASRRFTLNSQIPTQDCRARPG